MRSEEREADGADASVLLIWAAGVALLLSSRIKKAAAASMPSTGRAFASEAESAAGPATETEAEIE